MKQDSPQPSSSAGQFEDSTTQWRSRIAVVAILLLLPIIYFSPAIFGDFTLVPGEIIHDYLGGAA